MVKALEALAVSIASAMGGTVEFSWEENGYPVTINHASEIALTEKVAKQVAGDQSVTSSAPPLMAAEDFAFMLEEKPGTYIFAGNGESAGLHSAQYLFNDDGIPFGVSYFVGLVEEALKPESPAG